MDVLGAKGLRMHDRLWVQLLQFSLPACLTEAELVVTLSFVTREDSVYLCLFWLQALAGSCRSSCSGWTEIFSVYFATFSSFTAWLKSFHLTLPTTFSFSSYPHSRLSSSFFQCAQFLIETFPCLSYYTHLRPNSYPAKTSIRHRQNCNPIDTLLPCSIDF